jgi:hypothetical protein
MTPALSLETALSVSFFSVHYPERVDDALGLVNPKYYKVCVTLRRREVVSPQPPSVGPSLDFLDT